MIAQSIFAALAAVLVVSSLLVILHKSPVSSALFLVSAFCALAGIYLTLHAEFLGMVQVIVYAGAIMVLFLFVIMYLNLKTDLETGAQHAVRRGLGWIAGGVLLAESVLFLWKRWAVGPIAAPEMLPPGNTQAIGTILYTRYLFPFEITSMVLLVAIIGAIMISKPRRTQSYHTTVQAAHVPDLTVMEASTQAQAGAAKTSPPAGPHGRAQHEVEVES